MQKEINSILEMIYWLFMKELKAGKIRKDNPCFGKICKKRDLLKKNDEPNLFNY